MSLKSPLGKVRGFGSAGEGTGHFWAQRLTAAALIPLTLWFAFSLLGLPALDFYTVNAWAAIPYRAVLLSLLLLALIYHSSLGVQVVAEDYIHSHGRRIVVLGLLKLIHVGLAAAGLLAVFLVATRAAA